MTSIILVGKDIGSYTFDKTVGAVTLIGLETLKLEQLVVIHNATRGVDIYNPIDANKLGTIAANIVTLTTDTSTMANTDKLIIKIWYSVPDRVLWGDKLLKIVQNMLRVVSVPYYHEIGEFEVANHVPIRIDGFTPILPIGETDISELGVLKIPIPPRAGVAMEVVSTSAADLAETRATGTVTLTGGASGSVDSITIAGVEIMSASVPFNTDLTTTAVDVVNNINNNTLNKPEGYSAISVGAVITITSPVGAGIVENGKIVLSTTTTITTVDTNMIGAIAGGAGCYEVFVEYLQPDGTRTEEIVLMNGITPVPINGGLPVWRINDYHGDKFDPVVLSAAGDILLQDTATKLIFYRKISLGKNSDNTCFWTVPKGQVAVLNNWKPGSSGKEMVSRLKANVMSHANGVHLLQSGAFMIQDIGIGKDVTINLPKRMVFLYNEMTDIKITGEDLGAGGGAAAVNFELYYEPK